MLPVLVPIELNRKCFFSLFCLFFPDKVLFTNVSDPYSFNTESDPA